MEETVKLSVNKDFKTYQTKIRVSHFHPRINLQYNNIA